MSYTPNREELESFIYDRFKDAYGVKGRHYNFEAISLDELEAEAIRIDECANAQYEEDKKLEAEQVEDFKALIQRTIDMGAGDEETALRWLVSDEEFYHSQDVEHWVWKQGFLFHEYGRHLISRLEEIVEYKEMDWAA